MRQTLRLWFHFYVNICMACAGMAFMLAGICYNLDYEIFDHLPFQSAVDYVIFGSMALAALITTYLKLCCECHTVEEWQEA